MCVKQNGKTSVVDKTSEVFFDVDDQKEQLFSNIAQAMTAEPASIIWIGDCH